jgi:hypothetical protein
VYLLDQSVKPSDDGVTSDITPVKVLPRIYLLWGTVLSMTRVAMYFLSYAPAIPLFHHIDVWEFPEMNLPGMVVHTEARIS